VSFSGCFKYILKIYIVRTESLKFLQQFKGQDEAIILLNDVIPRFTLNSICGEFLNIINISCTFLI